MALIIYNAVTVAAIECHLTITFSTAYNRIEWTLSTCEQSIECGQGMIPIGNQRSLFLMQTCIQHMAHIASEERDTREEHEGQVKEESG